MPPLDEFVARIVRRARILRSPTRDDLERELHAHFEDALEEARAEVGDTDDLPAIVCGRFGNPDEIGRSLEWAHRLERRALLAADALRLMGLSVLAVAAVILLLQLAIATLLGISPSQAFPRLRGELLGFVSLALGYMSLYLEERIFQRFRVWLGFGVNLAVYACLFTIVSPVLGLETPAPGIAFIAGALARLLQTTPLRRAWYVATVFPTVAACLNAGRLLSIDDQTPLWTAVVVRWIGLTVACYFLTLLSRNHERRSPLVEKNHSG